jgi:hypothetical protein
LSPVWRIGDSLVPITTRTATHDYQYTVVGAVHGFRLKLKVEYTIDTDDPCKILGVRSLVFMVDQRGPGWAVVSKTQDTKNNVVAKVDCTSSSGRRNAMDQLYCYGDVSMALKTPGIPTPWGSIGSITVDSVQIILHLRVNADGSTEKDETVND